MKLVRLNRETLVNASAIVSITERERSATVSNDALVKIISKQVDYTTGKIDHASLRADITEQLSGSKELVAELSTGRFVATDWKEVPSELLRLDDWEWDE